MRSWHSIAVTGKHRRQVTLKGTLSDQGKRWTFPFDVGEVRLKGRLSDRKVRRQLVDTRALANKWTLPLDAGKSADVSASESGASELRRASNRVGRTTEDRARWLVKFAFSDLRALPNDWWPHLRLEVQVFLTAYPEQWFGWGDDSPYYSARDVRGFQVWLRAGLVQLVTAGNWSVGARVKYHFVWSQGRLEDLTFGPSGARSLQRDLFAIRVYEVLSLARGKLRRCLECGKPFVARKRQEYCAERCSQTRRTRAYRDRRRKGSHTTEDLKREHKRSPTGDSAPGAQDRTTHRTAVPRNVRG